MNGYNFICIVVFVAFSHLPKYTLGQAESCKLQVIETRIVKGDKIGRLAEGKALIIYNDGCLEVKILRSNDFYKGLPSSERDLLVQADSLFKCGLIFTSLDSLGCFINKDRLVFLLMWLLEKEGAISLISNQKKLISYCILLVKNEDCNYQSRFYFNGKLIAFKDVIL